VNRARFTSGRRSRQLCGRVPRKSAQHDQQRHAPAGVGEQDVEAEADLRDQAEDGECGQPPEVDREDRHPPGLEAAQEHGEAHAEEEREGAPGLLLHQHPDTPADQVLQAGRLEPHLLVKVHQNHPEEREPAKDVERVQAALGVERR
jgi:hypothetical protein